ncbi:FAD-dependent monooxygenase [Propionivibrio limicola]|uniref:FAD-dependent monooxygenase n=1 Tax=Propionivibrio limicola TaxID=167645 RepID=UPI0012925987|nr:FAD-dependent monooxygenase [Propionivibrio limicola]
MKTDILIIGAGPVGMALARALGGNRDAPSPFRITLIDRQPHGAWVKDPRALALAHGSRQLLERLDAWNASAATPIRTIHVSQRGGFGRTLIDARDYAIPALGYVLRYRDLADALDIGLVSETLLSSSVVETIETCATHATATIAGPNGKERITAKLVVHAEGTPADDPNITVRDYGQHAIVCEVTPDTPHSHQAWERFTPDGPLALLPLEKGYAVVFTVPPAKAREILALDDAAFLAVLNRQFSGQLRLTATGPRASFPLALRLRKQLTEPRQVWLGNTAQTLHPVSGQGFNLGLRDAWELAETLLAHGGDDPGHTEPLAAYARRRQTDRLGSAAFTHGIVHLFSNDIPPLNAVRGLGLLALDLVPPLRHFIARRMIWGARAWP